MFVLVHGWIPRFQLNQLAKNVLGHGGGDLPLRKLDTNA
jgi:hypothetical protein